jgi:hypothetical protein
MRLLRGRKQCVVARTRQPWMTSSRIFAKSEVAGAGHRLMQYDEDEGDVSTENSTLRRTLILHKFIATASIVNQTEDTLPNKISRGAHLPKVLAYALRIVAILAPCVKLFPVPRTLP